MKEGRERQKERQTYRQKERRKERRKCACLDDCSPGVYCNDIHSSSQKETVYGGLGAQSFCLLAVLAASPECMLPSGS